MPILLAIFILCSLTGEQNSFEWPSLCAIDPGDFEFCPLHKKIHFHQKSSSDTKSFPIRATMPFTVVDLPLLAQVRAMPQS
ncbi:hypothetical protein Pelo_4309 [Pelomyxa schiedti]|nr:hypothetical protein Pelo_4309 [Pelomyxa schiedti]